MPDNQQREQRILDAAADLFVHYGYDKTTVANIASRAGVSKGTIYLHFGSKDELLEALILRELREYAEKWLELIETDPQGGTIASMYTNSLAALASSPFMGAMFTMDSRVLGNYLRKPDTILRAFGEGGQPSARYQFVEMMQQAGAMRRDLDPKIVAHIMDILAYGLVGMDDIMPKEAIPPAAEVIAGVGKIMDRALAPEDGVDPAIGKTIVRQIAEATRQRFDQLEKGKGRVREQ